MCNFTLRDIEQTFEEFKIIYSSFDNGLEKVFAGYLICFLVLKNQTVYDYNVFDKGCRVSLLEEHIGDGNRMLKAGEEQIKIARNKVGIFKKCLSDNSIFSKKY